MLGLNQEHHCEVHLSSKVSVPTLYASNSLLVSEEEMLKASRVDSRVTCLLFFLYLISLGKVYHLYLSAREIPEGNRDRGRQQPPGIRPRNKVR